ncbi:MAG: hypothetical protein K6F39_03780 [Lachnospiraceae bacterium]|nr:hypothetical protein [Lachnospiraceae bacterium]
MYIYLSQRTAVKRAIYFLQKNPIIGELFDGELLEELCAEKTKQYLKYRKELKVIVRNAKKEIIKYDWLVEEEMDAYCECLENLKKELCHKI